MAGVFSVPDKAMRVHEAFPVSLKSVRLVPGSYSINGTSLDTGGCLHIIYNFASVVTAPVACGDEGAD